MHACYFLKNWFIRNQVFLRGFFTLFHACTNLSKIHHLSENQCLCPKEKVVSLVKVKNKFQFPITFCRFCCIFKIKE